MENTGQCAAHVQVTAQRLEPAWHASAAFATPTVHPTLLRSCGHTSVRCMTSVLTPAT